MKHNGFTKALAILLSVVSGVGMILGGLVVLVNLNWSMYTQSPEEYLQDQMEMKCYCAISDIAQDYLRTQAGFPEEIWESYYYYSMSRAERENFDYVIVDDRGASTLHLDQPADDYACQVTSVENFYLRKILQVGENFTYYPQYANGPTEQEPAPEEEWDPDVEPAQPTEATQNHFTNNAVGQLLIDVQEPVTGKFYDLWADEDGNLYRVYQEETERELKVTVYVSQEYADQLREDSPRNSPMGLLTYQYRYDAIWVFAACAAVWILTLVYLACAAGKSSRGTEIQPAGLNKIPLDLYFVLTVFAESLFIAGLLEAASATLWNSYSGDEQFAVLMGAIAAAAAGMALVFAGFWMALFAQGKAGNGYWWRKSVIGRFGRAIWGFLCMVCGKLFGKCSHAAGSVWEKRPRIGRVLKEVINQLPLTWQWTMTSLVLLMALLIFASIASVNGIGVVLYMGLACAALMAVRYAARAFGRLREGAKKMSQGNLNAKVNAYGLHGCFEEFAEDLNTLGNTCMESAREQLKSERMKTELITNVSHDIKTPLTSIINYVDLLQKATTEEERQEYLEVLTRQSQRMKKLIEDLMEMSKASSGNITVELAPTDVVESVNQALGEFSARFEQMDLAVIFRKPADEVMAMCDGKLLWRVMSNVMTNIVKYAMPGTRVYLDLSMDEYSVRLAMKNISAQELNITAEELMERFVRGDESRNTEGNGLGLNIAKSLMDLMKGSLSLVVDGDLFKVVLTLPRAE